MAPFTAHRADSVAALGELRLIESARRWLGNVCPAAPFGIGDDCAVVPVSPHPLLVTTDPVIFGRHFDETVAPRQAGAKLLKRNLSDIAAMGGRPGSAVISLALGPDLRVSWLRDFYRGLAETARRFRTQIVGGDITEGPRGFFGAFLTLHGEAVTGRVLTRSGARAGDHLFVTGKLGGSRHGHHFRFTPRLAEGQWLVAQPDVRAMMDLSDGLAKDLGALTAPRLAPEIFSVAVPLSPAAVRSARESGKTPLFHALSDGEDYELLFVLRASTDPTAFLSRWKKRFRGTPLTRLGRFVPAAKLAPASLRFSEFHGYEHLS